MPDAPPPLPPSLVANGNHYLESSHSSPSNLDPSLYKYLDLIVVYNRTNGDYIKITPEMIRSAQRIVYAAKNENNAAAQRYLNETVKRVSENAPLRFDSAAFQLFALHYATQKLRLSQRQTPQQREFLREVDAANTPYYGAKVIDRYASTKWLAGAAVMAAIIFAQYNYDIAQNIGITEANKYIQQTTIPNFQSWTGSILDKISSYTNTLIAAQQAPPTTGQKPSTTTHQQST